MLEARRVRRYVLRLDDGAVLPDALETALSAARVRRATLRGAGELRSVELAAGEDGAPRAFEGALELLALEGRFDASAGPGVEARVQVARETEAGLQLVGGRLLEAVARDVELEVEGLEDLEEVRGLAALEKGRAVRRERERDAAPAPDPGSPWAAVAEASAAVEAPPPEPAPRRPRRRPAADLPPLMRPDPIPEKRRQEASAPLTTETPERGDHVEHRQFGLCRVDGEDAHGGLVIRLPSGRRKTINLDYLEVLPPRTGADGRIFPLRPRRKG